MINVKDISKFYGDVKALNSVSFNIRKGEIFGFLGPNGAGKSTTINILNTLLIPDSGEVLFEERNMRDNKEFFKLNIGVVPQEIALYEDLSAYDNLMFWGGLYNITKADLKAKVEDALRLVGLWDKRNLKVKTYSGGMKRRVNIASAILHDPKILLMDEPTVGVDPQSRNNIFELIERLNEDGMTIIYTTHYMEEAERLCDTIAIIDNGVVVAQGTLEELRKISGVKDTLTLKLKEVDDGLISEIRKSVPSLEVNGTPNILKVQCVDICNEISHVINGVQNVGGQIESIDTGKVNLETIFLKLTGKQLRD